MSFNEIPLIGNDHSDETRNIINLMVQVINNRGIEILSDSAFLNWLHENGVKHLGEWSNAKEYDRQSVVIHEGKSYTSKKQVPAGIDILNEEFWVLTGNYNAQIENYRKETERVSKDLLLKSDKIYVDTELGKKTGIYDEDLIFNIPSDFNDLDSAIKYINRNHLMINTNIIINIEQGHRPELSVKLNGGSSKNITLTSDNDVVYISDVLTDSNTLIDLYNHDGFTLDCLIDMEGKGNHGIFMAENSYIKVNPGKGIMNAGNCGLYARSGSTAYAEESIFTGASAIDTNVGAGITSWGAIVNASGADVSNSGYYGCRAAHGGVLDFDNGKADNCGRHGIRASQNGNVTCRESTAKNSGTHGIYALDTSFINARQSDVSGSKETGYFAQSGSNINAFSGIANNCNIGVSAQQGSTVNFYSGTSNSCKQKNIEALNNAAIEAKNFKSDSQAFTCVHAMESSIINIQACRIENSVGNAIKAELSSRVNASVSNILKNGGTNKSAHGVISDKGSEVVLFNANVVTSGGLDLYINNGSRIIANECNTTLSGGSNKPNIEDCSPTAFNQMWQRGTIYA